MDFDKICTMFTMQEPFYGIILSSMERVAVSPSRCSTLAVTRNGNVFRIIYNKAFIDTLDIPTTLEVIKHEIIHVAFNHFSIWNSAPSGPNEQKMRNIAADLEVNGYINKDNVHGINLVYAENYGWEEMAGTKEYFNRLLSKQQQERQQKQQASNNVQKPCSGGSSSNEEEQDETDSQIENPGIRNGGNGQKKESDDIQEQSSDQNGVGNNDSGNSGKDINNVFDNDFAERFEEFDDHSQWPDDKESIEACTQIIEDMVIAAAAEVEKGCGKLPAEMKGRVDDIMKKRKPKPVADWKRYVRRYLGNEFSEFIRKSKKRESKRFPDASGNRHKRKSHILVGIDTSGSVSMPEYIEFFGQIRTLTSVATFDIVECDAAIQHVYQFRNRPNLEIHGGGGTSFVPVVDMFISNRKKYDALIYFTDGECDVPPNTPKDTLWVISSRGNKKRRSEFQINGASVVFIPKKDN